MPKTTKHLGKWQFKKGQSGNPDGGRKHNPLKKLGRPQFREIIEVALKEDVDALKKMSDDTSLTAVQMGVVRALYKAAVKGDWSIFKDIVEQLIGKNPDVVKTTHEGEVDVNLSGKVDVALHVKQARKKFDDEC